MPDQAIIDPPTPAGADDQPPRSEHFEKLAQFAEDTMKGNPPTQDPPKEQTDTRPKPLPEAKRETLKEFKAEKPAVQQPPKGEATGEDSGEKPAFTSPSAANFKKIVAERDEAKKKALEYEATIKQHADKAAALEREYSEYKAKTNFDPKEIETLKKEREDYSTRLERVALQETPKFQSHYNARFEAATNRALDAVGKDQAAQIKAVLEAPKSEWRKGMLNALVGEMDNEVDKLNLIAAVSEYDSTRDERDKQLENHKANLREYKALEAKREQEAQERQMANRKAILDETLKSAAKFEAFKTGDDPGHNAEVQKNRQLLEAFIMGKGDIPDSVLVMLPVLAAEGERLTKVVAQKDAKITELEEALKKYQGAEPVLEGGAEAKSTEDRESKSYLEQVEAQWPGVQRQR